MIKLQVTRWLKVPKFSAKPRKWRMPDGEYTKEAFCVAKNLLNQSMFITKVKDMSVSAIPAKCHIILKKREQQVTGLKD